MGDIADRIHLLWVAPNYSRLWVTVQVAAALIVLGIQIHILGAFVLENNQCL
jgi:hypothetical protein